MSAIWPVAMHDRSRMPELQPDLETETVHAVERMTMHAAEVTLFGTSRLRRRQGDQRAAASRPDQPVITVQTASLRTAAPLITSRRRAHERWLTVITQWRALAWTS